MNAAVFAEWLKRQGHRVARSASGLWYDAGPRIFQSVPFHRVIEPSEVELDRVLRENKVLGLRFSAPASYGAGRLSYHTLAGPPYGSPQLSANARSSTSRGLRRCAVKPISLERLAEEGWALQEDTMARQGRVGGMDASRWRRLCLAAKGLEGFEAWAALVDGRLAASILVAQLDDTGYFLYPQSHRAYFKFHVNNALVYTLTTELLSRPTIKTVFYGLESLDAPPSVDEFKFRMGYTAHPIRQRVVFHPWFAPLCNRFSHSLVRTLHRHRPENVKVAKAEGLLRFHLEMAEPVNLN